MRTIQTAGGNPNAPGALRLGVQGGADGLVLNSDGSAVFVGSVEVDGNLSVVGAVSAGSGLGTPNPYGIAGATMTDVLSCSQSYASSSGLLIAGVAPLAAGPIASIGTWLIAAGATSTGQNKMGLYTLAGTLIDITQDMTSLFTGTPNQMIDAPLASGPYQHAGGGLYIAICLHLTSAPSIGGTVGNSSAGSFPKLNGVAPTIYDTGITALPANLAPDTRTRNSAAFYMYAR